MREWHYWTRNKLTILEDYLPAFTTASTRSPSTLFLDLMAGQPENQSKDTGENFDGSPRIAMDTEPKFKKLAFGELNRRNADAIQADLADQHPNQEHRYRVFQGDCNDTIDDMLAWASDCNRGAVFAFIDQQSSEIKWATLSKLARFRKLTRFSPYKAELWILFTPSMFVRNLGDGIRKGTGDRVDAMFGNTTWRHIHAARMRSELTPAQEREELVNLFRCQLEEMLGYRHTVRIPMRMRGELDIYQMVFATDHDAGLKIMSHLYKKAAEREPQMKAEAEAIELVKKEGQSGQSGLWDVTGSELRRQKLPEWKSEPTWDPRETVWWPN